MDSEMRLNLLLSQPEGQFLEFKRSGLSGVDREIVAFANSGGGVLLLGVDNSGKVEKVGSGIGRMREAVKSAGLSEPEFEFTGFFTIIFRRGIEEVTTEVTMEVATEVTTEVRKMLEACRTPLSWREIMDVLGLSNREHVRKAYIKPALENGWLAMTIPDKPRSSKQRYVLTEKGKKLMEESRSGG